MKKFGILIFTICIYYTISATTYYVAPHGNDEAEGTINFPFRTINRAAKAAQTGDLVHVAAGIYRERVIPLRGGVTYRAEPGWKVYIKGSALWNPSWQSEGSGIYSASPADSLFNDVPSDFIDNHNPFQTPLSVSPNNILGAMESGGDQTLNYTLGQVFVNGEMYTEMGKKSLLETEKQWCYDREANRIYVMFGSFTPEEQKVEITVRRRVFAPLQDTGIDNITIDGFIIEHCGNQYPDRFQKSGFEQNMISGAVSIRNNNGWTIRNCMIRYAKTIGIDASAACNKCVGPTNILIEGCYIESNGQTGIFCRGTTNSIFRDNVIMYNNVLRFGKTEPHAKSTAGFKGLQGFQNNIIERNYFADNHSHGLWFDLNAINNTITTNVFVDNEEDAFFVELGGDHGFDKNFFTNNLVLGGNHDKSSLRYVDCGGMTYLHNLIIDHPSGTGENVAGFFSKTFNADRKVQGYRYTVGDFTFYNNLWIGVDVPYAHPYPDHYSSPSKFNYNVYSGSDSMRMFGIHRYCGSPWPYTTEQVAELVHKDLGDDSPGVSAMIIGDLVRLTATEWEKFWQVYGTTGDSDSFHSRNSSSSYERSTQTLTIELDFDPSIVGSENHPHSGKDFQGVTIPQNKLALPGPFQNLKSGKNTYKVWSGIPILKEGQVPVPQLVSISDVNTSTFDEFNISLFNNSDVPVETMVSVHAPHELNFSEPEKKISLDANEKKTVQFTAQLNGSPLKLNDQSIIVKADSPYGTSEYIHTFNNLPVQFSETPVTLNNLDSLKTNLRHFFFRERNSVTPRDSGIDWDDNSDLSADIYMGWDSLNLYIAVEVNDDIHHNIWRANDLINGDALLISLDTQNDAKKPEPGYDNNDYEIIAALSNDSVKVNTIYLPEGNDEISFNLQIQTEIIRKNTQTVYMISLPWSALDENIVFENKLFGVNVVVFDNDDKGLNKSDYWLELSAGTVESKNPSLYQKLILTSGSGLYKASFEVFKPEEGNISPLEGGTIKLGNYTAITGADGKATISGLIDGQYNYSVQKKGFTHLPEIVSIMSDTTFTDTLEVTRYRVNFTVNDADNNVPVPGAGLVFNGTSCTTTTEGEAWFEEVAYGTYNIEVKKEGYEPREFETVIFSDTTIVLAIHKATVQIKVVSRTTGAPVNRAVVNVGELFFMTDFDGNTTANKATEGMFHYRVEADGYFSLEDSLTLNRDTSITVLLTPIRGKIGFLVTDGENSIQGAVVNLAGSEQTTGSDGQTIFYNCPARGNYGFSIRKNGYYTMTDTIYLETDTTLTVTLEIATEVLLVNDAGVKIYPNPAKNRVHIETFHPVGEVQIYSANGSLICSKPLQTGLNSVDIGGFKQGMYLVKVIFEHGVKHQNIIKL